MPVTDNPLRTRETYERFLYTLTAEYPSVRRSTLVYIPSGTYFGRVEGFLLFDDHIVLCALEHLTFLPLGEIERYSYEVSRSEMTLDRLIELSAAEYCAAAYPHKQKLYWYDSFAHPHDPSLASTQPHHKHIPPDIKHHRVPAPDLSFTRPNLPFLIEEIERQVLQRSRA
jgi:hypothetical protein